MECASVHEQQQCVCYLGNRLCCIAGGPVGGCWWQNVLFNAPQYGNVCIVIVFRFLTQPELATEVNDCLTLHVHEQAG